MMRGAVVVAVALLLPVDAGAQVVSAENDLRVTLSTGVDVFAFGDADAAGLERIALSTTTVSVRVPLVARTAIGATARVAAGWLTRPDGSSVSLSGLTDTQVQVGTTFGNRTTTFGVTGVAVLPTGIDELDADELEVAGIIASDLLPFRISHWGSGGGVGMNVAVHCNCGSTGLGASAGYLAGREYEPFADVRYRPGNEFQVRATADRRIGAAGRLTVDLTMQHFDSDATGGRNLFQPGNRYRALASFSFPAGVRASGLVYASALRRSAGSALSEGATDMPLQDLWLAGGGVRIPRGAFTLLPSVDARVFRSADGLGQGYLGGVALAVERVGDRLTIIPSLRARLGSVVMNSDDRSMVYGGDLGVSLRFGASRVR